MTREFASQTKAYMETAGFRSQRELAIDSGVDHSAISRLLKGNRNATPRVAGALLHSLHVPGEHRVEFLLLAAGHDAISIKYTVGSDIRTPEQIKLDGRAVRRQATTARKASKAR